MCSHAQPGCPTRGAPPAAPARQLHFLTYYQSSVLRPRETRFRQFWKAVSPCERLLLQRDPSDLEPCVWPCAVQERIPEPGAIDNFGGPGPPYALLQGSLPPVPGGWKALAVESAPFVERGMVCLIGGGPDFFIAVGPHREWAHAHTVWGQVRRDARPQTLRVGK